MAHILERGITIVLVGTSLTTMQIYPALGTNGSQLIVATLVPSTPICLFFNLAKLQCKQTVVTDFCIGFVNKIHIIGKSMIKETWIAKIKEIGCSTEELITFCPFSPISAWSKKLPNFAVKHVDLSWDFGHDVPCMGRRIDVNNEGDLDTRPSSLYWQIEPGVFLAYNADWTSLLQFSKIILPARNLLTEWWIHHDHE